MEDNFIAMVSKGKGLYPDLQNKNVASSVNNDLYIYEDIKHRLIIPENKEKFLDGVKDIYHIIMGDYYELYGQSLVPTISDISDFIDEENRSLIDLLLGEDNIHTDNVIILYIGLVTVSLESYVEEAVRIMGLPYRDSSNSTITNRGGAIPYYDPYQLRMFGDELYEY